MLGLYDAYIGPTGDRVSVVAFTDYQACRIAAIIARDSSVRIVSGPYVKPGALTEVEQRALAYAALHAGVDLDGTSLLPPAIRLTSPAEVE